MTKRNSIESEERREFLQGTGFLLLTTAFPSLQANPKKKPESNLEHYLRRYHALTDGSRQINPQGYIAWLKENVFTKGELNNLPSYAVILHDAKTEQHLKKLGFSPKEYRELQTGSTDPNLLHIVKRNKGKDFILNRGLPGAGGIATQAAELYALGVKYIIHIGTCGLLGESVKEGIPIVSQGAYKDSAALLLSTALQDEIDIIAYPSKTLTKSIKKILGSTKYIEAMGFTIPIFYFQPTNLLEDLINDKFYPGKPKPGYIEMEASSLFQTAQLMGTQAASLVVGGDRYISKQGKIIHNFYDVDSDKAKSEMLEVALKTFDAL